METAMALRTLISRKRNAKCLTILTGTFQFTGNEKVFLDLIDINILKYPYKSALLLFQDIRS